MQTATAEHIASKSEFAALSRVSPGRVTQWITAGKIDGDALVGEGRTARIRVAVAQAQLRQRLDVGQRFGNGLGTQISSAPPAPITDAFTDVPRTAYSAPVVDRADEELKAAKLAEIQFRNRKAAEEEAQRRGRYTDTTAAKREMARLAGEMLKLFEGSLTELASAIAARFQVPQRDVLHLMRTEFRGVRARAAESLRRQAQDLPAVLDDEIETTD